MNKIIDISGKPIESGDPSLDASVKRGMAQAQLQQQQMHAMKEMHLQRMNMIQALCHAYLQETGLTPSTTKVVERQFFKDGLYTLEWRFEPVKEGEQSLQDAIDNPPTPPPPDTEAGSPPSV